MTIVSVRKTSDACMFFAQKKGQELVDSFSMDGYQSLKYHARLKAPMRVSVSQCGLFVQIFGHILEARHELKAHEKGGRLGREGVRVCLQCFGSNSCGVCNRE